MWVDSGYVGTRVRKGRYLPKVPFAVTEKEPFWVFLGVLGALCVLMCTVAFSFGNTVFWMVAFVVTSMLGLLAAETVTERFRWHKVDVSLYGPSRGSLKVGDIEDIQHEISKLPKRRDRQKLARSLHPTVTLLIAQAVAREALKEQERALATPASIDGGQALKELCGGLAGKREDLEKSMERLQNRVQEMNDEVKSLVSLLLAEKSMRKVARLTRKSETLLDGTARLLDSKT